MDKRLQILSRQCRVAYLLDSYKVFSNVYSGGDRESGHQIVLSFSFLQRYHDYGSPVYRSYRALLGLSVVPIESEVS